LPLGANEMRILIRTHTQTEHIYDIYYNDIDYGKS
jgi:hypothetical protein